MTYFIRHTERLDYVNETKWKHLLRYKINPLDPPITHNGIAIAENKLKYLLKDFTGDFDYIYSSPMTRCILTSIIFQTFIKNKYNVFIPIRIEYGIAPTWKKKYDGDKLIDSFLEMNDDQYPSFHYTNENLFKSVGIDHFDMNYKSILTSTIINNELTTEESDKNRIYTINKLATQFDDKKMTIVCTHGEILELLHNYFNICRNSYIKNDDNYCAWIKFDIVNNKLIFNETSPELCSEDNSFYVLSRLILCILFMSFIIYKFNTKYVHL